MVKLLDGVLKNGENITGRVAGLKLCREGMSEKVVSSLFLLRLQSSMIEMTGNWKLMLELRLET